MNPPPRLYRSVKGHSAFDNYVRGNLWFRSHGYFRKQDWGDRLEGIGSYDLPNGIHVHDVTDEYPIQPAYFMSFSEDSAAARKYGDYHLTLADPIKFRESVRTMLPSNPDFVHVSWIKMKYRKTMKVDQDMGVESIQRKLHCKPVEFSDEKEWRLQIQFMHSFRIMNDTLKFRWPKVGHCFRACSPNTT